MNLLQQTLRQPGSMEDLDETEWDLLIRQARSAELLAHLYYRLSDAELFHCVPEKAWNHFNSEQILARKQQEAALWETLQIERMLAPLGIPVILLKGAAYLQAKLPSAAGRFFNDIDILVPKTLIQSVEEKLQQNGWLTTHHNEYDQRYYRKWMHEIPPLQHIGRRSTIDVHHSILPLTARLHPDPEKLIESSIQVDPDYELYILCPTDMILHSATHLFHDGELEHGLRDLVDLDRLLRHFAQSDGFWNELVQRSIELDLSLPLFYALRYTTKILDTPVPENIVESDQLARPSSVATRLMDSLFLRALAPAHKSCKDGFTPSARWLLYIRSHYLRMPPHLLLPHLFHKGFVRPYTEWKEARAEGVTTTPKKIEKEAEIDIFK
ncbi:MAG: nucleotidyltransferase family protein [Magnetovibrio sp.]|nr:nucleotidyltransferase family protein [Magnetovibrio sp.]